MKNNKKLKILLSAFACHPNKGSESGIGWNWLKEIAKYNDVWILFNKQGQEKAVIEKIAKLPYKNNIHPISIKLDKKYEKKIKIMYFFGNLFFGIPNNFIYHISSIYWQKKAYKVSRKIIKKEKIDLIHHVTYASWQPPSYLWKLNKPFFLGPISGAQKTPKEGYPFLTFRGKISEFIRTISFVILWNLWYSPKNTIKKAKIVFE